jgi:VIT1/CCC1 family predicted Fe2+/Mn2+ transporter
MHNALTSALPNPFPLETTRRIVRVQLLTLAWMTLEAVVSLVAAWMARSPTLLGFGGDSAVELLSAAVVLWRFRSPSRGEHEERWADRIAGGLLFIFAAFVILTSVLTLLGRVEALPSHIGIMLLILAAVVMPTKRFSRASLHNVLGLVRLSKRPRHLPWRRQLFPHCS